MADMVNHPAHYQKEGRKECIEEMIDRFGVEAVKHFCLLNAYKYMYRHEAKGGQQDVDKANWYLNKYAELGGDAVL
jgi:hypothetical protein